MQIVTIGDPTDAGLVWHVRGAGSVILGGVGNPEGTPGIEVCREDVREQAPVILEKARVAGLVLDE